jgi:hypothetical protein
MLDGKCLLPFPLNPKWFAILSLDNDPVPRTGSAVACYTEGSNSKPSDKDTIWSDEKEQSR